MKASDKTIGLTEIYLKGYPHKRNYPFKVGTQPLIIICGETWLMVILIISQKK